ncbi:MAG: 30S ribosomal protein S17 [Spirochaetales bacterium]|jgi:small subunit ribosomal protein S17|nr:30S ribosomal protein S17 [Spirochaetales bacterium]
MTDVKIIKKIFQGKVVSDKMEKTITVLVERRTLHPIYQKYVTQSKKFKAHDETNDAKVGDIVRIIECRPISKDKTWNLLEIVERAR